MDNYNLHIGNDIVVFKSGYIPGIRHTYNSVRDRKHGFTIETINRITPTYICFDGGRVNMNSVNKTWELFT